MPRWLRLLRRGRPRRLSRFGAGPAQAQAPAPVTRAATASPAAPPVVGAAAGADAGGASTATLERPRATPPVRKLARELGVDLAEVPATGDRGLVTRHDVEQFSAGGRTHAVTEVPETRLPQGARERETRIPIRGVRKHTAEAMVQSAFTAPHATVFLTVDVTETMALLERLKSDRAFEGVRMTFLAVVAKAMCIAAMRTPSINSRWDAEANEIVEFGYVNLGIAAATPRGLLVPTIPDADRLTLVDLARALTDLVAVAREGRTPPERLTGGTISVSNVGVFGVDAGTPILNPGEAGILALGAVRRQPWEHDGGIALRDVVTLSVSFDHRLVDGEQGSRFIADVGRDPARPGFRADDGLRPRRSFSAPGSARGSQRTGALSPAQAMASSTGRAVAASMPPPWVRALCGVELMSPNVACTRTRSTVASSDGWRRPSTAVHCSM